MNDQTSNTGNLGSPETNGTEKKIVATPESVFAACEQLYMDAENITRDKVSNMIGGGSPVTVMRYINEWREHRATENKRNRSELESAFADFGRRVDSLISKRQAEFESALLRKIGAGDILSNETLPSTAERPPAAQTDTLVATHAGDDKPIVENNGVQATSPDVSPADDMNESNAEEGAPFAAAEHHDEPPLAARVAPAIDSARQIDSSEDQGFGDTPDSGFIADYEDRITPSPSEQEEEFFPAVSEGDFELRPEDLLALGTAGKAGAEDLSLEDIDAALNSTPDRTDDIDLADIDNALIQSQPAAEAPIEKPRDQHKDSWRSFDAPLL
ncbi:DNA-binding protein [Alcanivorax sp. 1008]|uniref:DNA-binding protein n=1 Tax=Alcanivorax sp. 1008 TaxID=2816853 RepID=UPI001D655562|nr:DNA-binding protein [Alcanivorax sp. 1008]MCC1496790.1 DNA-binding protein [Alcanivorax sp. 1008]